MAPSFARQCSNLSSQLSRRRGQLYMCPSISCCQTWRRADMQLWQEEILRRWMVLRQTRKDVAGAHAT
jgi:hypothetical protein